MKKTIIGLLSLASTIMPLATVAQTNVKAAFDAIIKCPEAKITESHQLEKDPMTNIKTGQCDIYNFILPADKINLVKNAVSAFNKDSEMAYSINQGNVMSDSYVVSLAVGDGSSSGVIISEPERDYIYATFLAPLSESPEGNYRYAYGMNYKEEKGKIEGKLIVTYATTLDYRQKKAREQQFDILRNLSGENAVFTTGNSQQQEWFSTLMSYFQSMTSANSQTRIALATKAYKLIRDADKYPEVTESDKNTVREILRAMISDKKYSETVLNQLLNQCLVILK